MEQPLQYVTKSVELMIMLVCECKKNNNIRINNNTLCTAREKRHCIVRGINVSKRLITTWITILSPEFLNRCLICGFWLCSFSALFDHRSLWMRAHTQTLFIYNLCIDCVRDMPLCVHSVYGKIANHTSISHFVIRTQMLTRIRIWSRRVKCIERKP